MKYNKKPKTSFWKIKTFLTHDDGLIWISLGTYGPAQSGSCPANWDRKPDACMLQSFASTVARAFFVMPNDAELLPRRDWSTRYKGDLQPQKTPMLENGVYAC